jgi:hypothetical protein
MILPFFHCKTIKDQITKLRRTSSTINNATTYEAIREKIKELNKTYKKETYKTKNEYYIKLNEINSPKEFWKLWSKAEFNQQTEIPMFKDNKEYTIEKNEENISKSIHKERRRIPIQTNHQL